MLILLSPAKSLDMNRTLAASQTSLPAFASQTQQLAAILKKKSVSEIKALMSLSDNLAQLNHQRFQDFSTRYTSDNAAPALAAFDGDVYEGLDAASLPERDVLYAQQRLRILSGLYGLLRPLDLMQPYRLEMGTKLPNPKGEDLYDFWGNELAKAIDAAAKDAKASHIVNLASNEYFKAANAKAIQTPIITPQFKERKDGQLKIISFYAKKARGTMARWIVQQRAESPDALRGFAEDGYRFDSANEAKGELLFVRG